MTQPAMAIRLEYVNVKQFEAQLQQLSMAVASDTIERALTMGGLKIQNEWQREAPYKTGTYRKSIHVEYEKLTDYSGAALIGTNLTEPPYPIYLEFGTIHMVANPSGRRAWDQSIDAAGAEIIAVFNLRLAKAAAK